MDLCELSLKQNIFGYYYNYNPEILQLHICSVGFRERMIVIATFVTNWFQGIYLTSQCLEMISNKIEKTLYKTYSDVPNKRASHLFDLENFFHPSDSYLEHDVYQFCTFFLTKKFYYGQKKLKCLLKRMEKIHS